MIANYMFFDIDLPCFSRKLIRVNNPRVAYVTTGTGNKIKNFGAHTHRSYAQEEGERREGATPAALAYRSRKAEKRGKPQNGA